jgi:ribosomal-protein-alanine N-acetyltransferase
MELADLDRVVEIAESLKQAPHWSQAAYRTALDPDSLPRRISLVAADLATGAVAGFAVAVLIPPEAELEMIAVEAGSQRRGVARQLFTALCEQLRLAQVKGIFLEVRSSNHSARGLYHALGFVQGGRRLSYYADPVEDAILMSLPLIPPSRSGIS